MDINAQSLSGTPLTLIGKQLWKIDHRHFVSKNPDEWFIKKKQLYMNCAEILLTAGADPYKKDRSGKTFIQFATKFSSYFEFNDVINIVKKYEDHNELPPTKKRKLRK